MATPPKPAFVPGKAPVKPAPFKPSATATATATGNKAEISGIYEPTSPVFGRINYVLMLASIGLIFLGFFVMTLDKELYGFGVLGITVGPLISFIGFLLAAASILVKDKNTVV
ncbi:MAG: DUF3098 domain-containing protein [Bacteroidota bacterium]